MRTGVPSFRLILPRKTAVFKKVEAANGVELAVGLSRSATSGCIAIMGPDSKLLSEPRKFRHIPVQKQLLDAENGWPSPPHSNA